MALDLVAIAFGLGAMATAPLSFPSFEWSEHRAVPRAAGAQIAPSIARKRN
jgi:hypothetical protein